MILKRLFELSEREGLLDDAAFDVAPVACMIQIGENGEFQGFTDLRTRREDPAKKKGGKPKTSIDKGKPMQVPVRPVVLEIPKPGKASSQKPASRWKTTDPAASGQEKPAVFLADAIARVLPVQRLIEEKDRAKFDAQRSTFWRFVDHVATVTEDPAMKALQNFGVWLRTDSTAEEILAKAIETKEFPLAQLCTFSWITDIGAPILDRATVRSWWREFFSADRAAQEADTFKAICQVTEIETAIPNSIKAKINGLVSIGCRADAYLVTAVESSESYGLSGAATGMVSARGVDGFTRGINALIANGLPGGQKTSLRIGSTMFLFWTRSHEPHDLMLFENPVPDDVARLITSANSGRLAHGVDERNFYCLTISGNSARIVVRDYLEEPLSKIETNLSCWFRDLEIVDDFNGERNACFPLWRLVYTTIRTGDDIPPGMSSAMLSAALKGTAVPMQVLSASLRRLRVEHGREQFRTERMALIKLILNRSLTNGEIAMTSELDPSRTADRAYVCGRLFACLAYIQAFERSPKQHGFGQDAAMLSGYYGAASAAPRSVFGTLLRQTQHRLNKLGAEHAGFVTNRVKEIEEFSQHLGSVDDWHADFPAVLPPRDQGRFALGFYHQRAQYRASSAERASSKADKN